MVRVSKVMSADVPTFGWESKIGDAAKLLAKEGSGCAVIVNNNKLIGIVTELDFVRKVISKGKSFKEPIIDVMNYPVTFMTPNMKLDEALKIIDTKGFKRYPVVENDEIVGLVTKKDVINSISDNLKFHRNIQNIVLVLFVLFEVLFFMFSIFF